MYTRWRTLVLHWLRVPPEPHPPAGDPASLRVFRAGRNYFRLRLFGWFIPQVLAFIGILFWTVVLLEAESIAREARAAQATAPVAPPPEIKPAPATPTKKGEKRVRTQNRIRTWDDLKRTLAYFLLRLPSWAFPLLWVLKFGAILLYLVQIPFTYAVRRLDFELRWYVVTDRSLRIRTGVWYVQELTMSFANLQQVSVMQGPLQRLLGLADVQVQSAGGSTPTPGAHGATGDSLHTATFHSVDNAEEIRDLILERLRKFRAAGLGDPDDHRDHPAPVALSAAAPAADAAVLDAAKELLTEARALRRALAE